MAQLDYSFRDKDMAAEEKIIRAGLNQYLDAETGLERRYAGAFCHDNDKMIGGVTAHLIGGNLSVKLVWVDEAYRGQAIATNLMRQIEEYAADQGMAVSFVDTMSYQAPEFYVKIGYQEDARVKNFYAGFDRIFYKKDLLK